MGGRIMNNIEQLQAWGIPTDYDVAAVQAIRNHDGTSGIAWTPELTQAEMEERTQLLLGCEVTPFVNYKTARMAYGYAVQETVRAQGQCDPELVISKMEALIKDMPFIVKDYEVFSHDSEGPAKLDAVGQIKRKKGVKKALAIEVYNKEKGTERTRQEWIALLMEAVGLSKAGASTYYAQLKRHDGAW